MQLTFSVAAPPASPSASRDFVRALLTRAETSPSPSLQSLIDTGLTGSSGKTFRACSLPTAGGISGPSSGGLGELGYGWCWRVLDAQYVRVDGYDRAVPQRRNRVWVVGCLGDWRGAAAVLSEPESLLGHSPPRRQAGARVAGSLTRSLGGSGGGGPRGADDNAAQAHHIVAFGGNDTRGPIEGATAVNAHGGPSGRLDFESETFVAEVAVTVPAGGNATGGDRQPGMSAETADSMPVVLPFDTTQITHPENRSRPKPPAIAFDARQTDVLVYGDKAGPLDTGIPPVSVQYGAAVRRLTPLECERLQGFPDGYTAIAFRGKPASDGPRYKALGNSWAVNVARWIGRRIELVEDVMRELAREAAE